MFGPAEEKEDVINRGTESTHMSPHFASLTMLNSNFC